MKLFKLNRSVLGVKNNPAQFLNGLTSNDLEAARNAFLNIHGRIIAVFDHVKIDEDQSWIVMEDEFIDGLLEHLDRYIKLSKVDVQRLDKHVYFDTDEGASPAEPADVIIPQKSGRVIVSGEDRPCQVMEEEFTLFRLENNIPCQGIDYRDEFVLNVSPEDVVSFTKGCFLGQEPVSKVHNRSSPTWQLVVKYENECSEEELGKMTSRASDPDSDLTRGFVFIRNNQ